MIDVNHKWCVYKTTHPDGFYYFGKGLTKAVAAGTYKGSGTSLLAAWEVGGKPKHEWTSVILETFPAEPLVLHGKHMKDPGELKAYAREKELITFEMLCDPFCLNDVPGGKGGFNWGRVSKRALAKRRKSVKAAFDRPEVKERHSAAIKKALDAPGRKKKMSDNMSRVWEERRSGKLPLPTPHPCAGAKTAEHKRKLREADFANVQESLVYIDGLPSIKQTSKKLGIDKRRLERYLRDQGYTFAEDIDPKVNYRSTTFTQTGRWKSPNFAKLQGVETRLQYVDGLPSTHMTAFNEGVELRAMLNYLKWIGFNGPTWESEVDWPTRRKRMKLLKSKK